MNTISIKIPHLTPERFEEICQANQELQLERTATGELIVMPPTTPWTGNQNFGLIVQLGIWIEHSALGKGFDSSTGFTLPNGAVRSPDATWVSDRRWQTLTAEEQQTFSRLSPDFVIELRSGNDSLEKLREKMQEYIDNDVQLCWLIDPIRKQVEIYRPGQNVEVLGDTDSLSGEDILPGFVLNLNKIW